MSAAMVSYEGAGLMSRLTHSFRSLLGERPNKTLLVHGLKSSTRLVKEAKKLTESIQSVLAARPDVELVSEQGWLRTLAAPEREASMLVGSVAFLSGNLVLRLQLLDGRNFRVLDEVETALGEDLGQATVKLADAVAVLLSSDPDMRRGRGCWL